jgi:hypothetical protein
MTRQTKNIPSHPHFLKPNKKNKDLFKLKQNKPAKGDIRNIKEAKRDENRGEN